VKTSAGSTRPFRGRTGRVQREKLITVKKRKATEIVLTLRWGGGRRALRREGTGGILRTLTKRTVSVGGGPGKTIQVYLISTKSRSLKNGRSPRERGPRDENNVFAVYGSGAARILNARFRETTKAWKNERQSLT